MLRIFAAAIAALCLISGTAYAAEAITDTAVSLPVGEWVGDVAALLLAISGSVIMWAFRHLPSSIVQVLKTMQAEQLLGKALAYGINATAGAAKGKTLTVDVGNAVVAQAARYAVNHGPTWLINWMGGMDAIAEKIIARLDVEEAAAASGDALKTI
ncbi:hypothetical protein [Consotaella salsifontis]|uniref:Bacteriophage holin of superfamily 6 (Holin_LLH) n=1 Tax=Consotaella salsifontis TaxID=1365950 RepID=A0A1T4SST4_9HYPH|nr:hypothetical protein [Consotaella salsifontis]SKA30938.1 hypothetical protein SAMN05428963_11388 [Consotaella salsifontis]